MLTAKKIKENIERFGLIEPGDVVLVSFSGGPDSTVLLYILSQLAKPMKFDVRACYINHNIRAKKTLEKEIRHCRMFCERLGVDFVLLEADIPTIAKEEKLTVEEAGHVFRKEALPEICREEGCNKIATGHHLDDRIETILFRLFRGTGPGGIDPIKPKAGQFIRPLFDISRSEIEDFIKKTRLLPVLDESNLDIKYTRNYIRNKIIPTVEKHFGPGFKSSLLNFSEIIGQENVFLADVALLAMKKIVEVTPGGKLIVDLPRLAGYDLWLKRRIIKNCLEEAGGRSGAGSFEDIGRVETIISGKIKAADLRGGMHAASDHDKLYFFKGRIKIKAEEAETPGLLTIDGLNSAVKFKEIPASKAVLKTQRKGLRVDLDIDRVAPPITVRGIKAGDVFVPLGMTGKKKVGDFLTDQKVSKYIRDEILVIEDKRGIIWLAPYRIADRVKIDNKTKKVLRIDLLKNANQQGPEVRPPVRPG